MTKSLTVFLGIILFLFSAASCGTGSKQPLNVRDLTAIEQSLVTSSNQFGFSLLSEVVAKSDGGNLFISPLSVSIALGMTYNGAAGSTEEGMRAALAFGELTQDEINQGYKDLIEMLCNMDPQVTMQIANSIWYRQGFEVLQTFLDALQNFFDALVTAVDFTDAGTKDLINSWVKDKTHEKIDKIIDTTNADMVMILINAIYFKGTWTYEFDPKDTNDGTFHAPDGDKTVKMMHLHGDVRYRSNADFQAVDLPYGGELFSMTVFLPREGKTPDDIIAQLTDQNWAAWMEGFLEQELDLSLPRFELEYEKTLNDVLIALGMQDAFDPLAADFSGIKPDHQMWISEVKHKTFVKVNEEGTEAAAVTSVSIVDTAVGDSMVVDRPFLFVIHDKHSKAMIFMGKIVDPPSE